MYQCYECGRTTVAVNRRDIHKRTLGFVNGSIAESSSYERVNLCGKCAASHDYWRTLRTSVAVVILTLLVMVALWIVIGRR